jgi:integrase
MNKQITEHELKRLAPGARITDAAIEGFVARCLPSGKVSFGYQYTDKTSGARRWLGLGLHGAITVNEARELAKQYAGKVAARRDPAAELEAKQARSENTVDNVLDKFLAIYVPQKKLRSAAAIAGAFARYVRPALGGKVIYDLDRADITKMLDKIAAEHPRMADVTLAYLRKAFNWQQTRDGKFKTPIVIGMARTTTKDYARDRILAPDELADIFRALGELELGTDAPACYPAFIKTLLLTACRRNEVALMSTAELGHNTWVIPKARYKTKIDHLVPIIPALKNLLPKHSGDGFVFSSDGGKTAFSGFSKAKEALDEKIAEIRKREKRKAMPEWRLHDLRRTARTMMAADGVADNIAERVLGHVITGVHGVYNRFDYYDEKVDALTKLAAHVERTVTPPPAARKLRVVAG